MPTHDIVVIGASAGGVEAVTEIARKLPADFPAAVFVVIHFPSQSTSVMPAILNRVGALPASHPTDGETIRPSRIYVARPDVHLHIRPGEVRLSRGPKENGHRPAVDTLFRSAARSYGPRVIGVVLSGNLDDGTAGLYAVKSRRGLAVVQEPDDALFVGMPRSAVENVDVDYVVPLRDVPALLERLVGQPVDEEDTPMSDEIEFETEIAGFGDGAMQDRVEQTDRPGNPSAYTCPECHGSLWEIRDGELIRFRCRVGHAYSADTLIAEQTTSLEAALWTALRALEEHAALTRRLAARAAERGQRLAADRFTIHARDTEQRASVVRAALNSDAGILGAGSDGTAATATSAAESSAP